MALYDFINILECFSLKGKRYKEYYLYVLYRFSYAESFNRM